MSETRRQEEANPEDNSTDNLEPDLSVERPVSNTIEKLQKESKFTRSENNSANCTIELEGEKFHIETIERGDDPKLEDVQKLFLEVFGEEEVDPIEIMRGGVDGITPFKTKDIPYRVVTIRNEQGGLVTVLGGAPLELLDNDGKKMGDSAYFVGYAVSDPNVRQKGLAREAYISALIDAQKGAEKAGSTLKFAIGECTDTSEHFWNNVGWKRIYGQKGEKGEYSELEYVQPALDFDKKTGGVAEGAGEAKEHLMVDSFGHMPPSREDLKNSYNAFIRWCNQWPREAFKSNKAYKKHQAYVEEIKSKFHADIDSSKTLLFLDEKNRAKAQDQGVTINEYQVGEADTGEEDF